LGLGESTLVATFLTLSLEGVSLKVPPNQFARKITKKIQKNQRMLNRRNRTNENEAHVKTRKCKT
jgi:hypothetical protein